MKTNNFYSHHSAWGSYSSFIIGKINQGGGFVLNNVQPPESNIYIGYVQGKSKPKLFPFFGNYKIGLSQDAFFNSEVQSTYDWCRKNTQTFKENEIDRTMQWASESWKAGNIEMIIHTPFGNIPDPGTMDRDTARFWFAPLIFIELVFDNSKSEDNMTGAFVLQGMRRPLSDTTDGKLLGAAIGSKYGLAVKAADDIKEVVDWNAIEAAFSRNYQLRRLASEGGLTFSIQPGEKKRYVLALATFTDEFYTSNHKAQFYYSRFFRNLDDVLQYGSENFQKYIDVAMQRNKELADDTANKYRKFLLSHATRSYMANTQLLIDENDEPVFAVNEGEYQMINTLDLTVDQVFWELHFTPWTVKNVLDFHLKYYSYYEDLSEKNPNNAARCVGFCHDEGVSNMFSPDGYSSYEISELTGCFSYMTHEQILNWVLTAGLYGILENDNEWLKKHKPVFIDIYNSMVGRDANNDGIMDIDSTRCGSGSEITTYDSLDVSLGQARNNLYLAVKTWAGYLILEKIFAVINEDGYKSASTDRAKLCANSVIARFDNKNGFIPAVFEKNNESRIIPAIEGLVYPYVTGDKDAVSADGRFGEFINTLNSHLTTVLKKGICIDKKSGGWKLSSTSNNTWMSKIFISQFVAQHILSFKTGDWDKWDEVHTNWQQTSCSKYAATDQVTSDQGLDLGSRLYPRLVTSLLWFKY